MRPIDNIFPANTLTEEETTLIYEMFAHNATVRKYLRCLGAECAKELLEVSSLHETAERLVQQHSVVSGKLIVLTTLLQIGVE